MDKKKRVIRGLIVAFLAVLYFIYLCCFRASAAEAIGRAPSNLVLSWTGDTASTQTVSWMCENDGGTQSFRCIETSAYPGYFESPGTTGSAFKEAEASCGKVSDSIYSYHATIEDLKPDTSYTYTVGSDADGWSSPSTFTTGNNDAGELKFMFLGDAQFADDMEADNEAWGELLETAYEKNPDIDFVISAGDLVNNGNKMEQWLSILKNGTSLFSKVSFMTNIGNHECFNYYQQAFIYLKLFALPENGPSDYKEEFYSFDYGNTHVAVLNTNIFWKDTLLGDFIRQVDVETINNWIRRDLSQSTAENKIVILHHPAYKIFLDDACDKVHEEWVPIFEETGVDLVLSGHQHLFSRTYPMYEENISYENGITYITSFSGPKTYGLTPVWYMEKEIGYIGTYQIIDIKNDGIRVGTYDRTGREIDKYHKYAGFYDVSPLSWFAPYVSIVVDNDIFGGTNSYTFSPSENMTRAMMATVLSRIDKAQTAGYENVYDDVPDGRWYTEAVNWANGEGIISGTWKDEETGINLFSPSDDVTREQMAVFFYNYAKYKGVDTDGAYADRLSSYSDCDEISDWAKMAVSWCTSAGLMGGRDDGSFAPKDTASRAEVAVIVSNYLTRYK